MKINSIQNENKINFGSQRIFNVKLLDKLSPTKSTIDAYISELERSDDSLIENIAGRLAQTRWGKDIIDSLHALSKNGTKDIPQSNKFYMVECPQMPLREQIMAFAKGDINEGNIFIDKLNSQREYNGAKKISGAGSCIIYAYVKLAELLDKNSISLQSSKEATKFYDKINLKRAYTDGRRDYFLSCFDFPDFIQKIEKEYSITPIKQKS